jgi:single-strand DNA-binding protein
MGASVNQVTILGRLGRDPECQYTQGNQAVAHLSVATDESWGKGEERQSKTEWHRVVAWGKLAEICQQFLRKGSQVYVQGRLQTREWEAKDGTKRSTTEIVAANVQFLGGGSQASDDDAPRPSQQRSQQRSQPAQTRVSAAQQALGDDDIPF